METGERGLYEDDVSAALGFLRVPAEIRQELMDLVRSGNERNWHEIGGQLPIPKRLRDLIRFENEAVAIYSQRVLDRVNQLHLIIEEMVLRRTMDDPVMMYGQLQHLVATAARRNVSIRMLPFDAIGPLAAQGSLKIIDCPGQPALCYEESRSTSAFLEDDEYIARAMTSWKQLSSASWSEEDSRQRIAELASKLRRAT